jgi:uncharacterized protein YycO
MWIDRRECVLWLGSLALAATTSTAQAQPAKKSAPLPNKANFQSGDFVWPKKPGTYIPYNSGETSARQADELRWLQERDRCVAALRKEPGHFTASEIDGLANLTYAEFYGRYAAGMQPGVAAKFSGESGLYVGHVGIIEIDNQSVPWVVEALGDRGVIRQSYEDWLRGRPGESVWHGRLKNENAARRASIVAEGKKYVGRPYDFWNFNLADDTAFYCSKLAWLSVYRALNVAVDGDQNPKRAFWFSPKQLLNTASMAILHAPDAF